MNTATQKKTNKSNELRVFISSTFNDLQKEREHLVKKIFPELRALCRERGITLTEVDLRWGITEEDNLHGRVIRTCLEEVDRCRPYFIGITGDRYGFIPKPEDITKDEELLAQYPWVRDSVALGASMTDMEFHRGVLDPVAKGENPRAKFYFKKRNISEAPDEERTLLENLQSKVYAAGLPVEEYSDPDGLGKMVRDGLLEIITSDFGDITVQTPLEAERSKHAAFAASRRLAYIPNPEYLEHLDKFAASKEPPLVIYAESGSGKSSLVAYWADEYREKSPEANIVEHYIGVGASSTDHYGIMRHIMEEIKFRFDRTEEIPGTPEEIERQFANWLGFTLGAPMIVIIDGINQLSGVALNLEWLPKFIPENIRVIITTTVEQTLVHLRERGWGQLGMQPLHETERKAIIHRLLKQYGKALLPKQVDRIADDEKCAHPLFLRTLLEELRVFGVHERLEEIITRYLDTTGTEDLFQLVLARLEEDYGEELVRETMSLIWAARTGLTEGELQELTEASRLEVSALVIALDYHLLRAEGLLTFFHDYLRRAVEKRYLAEEAMQKARHLQLADYFQKIVDELVEKELAEAAQPAEEVNS